MGYMDVNWPTLTMTFISGDRKVMPKRDPTLTTKEATLKTLTHTWEEKDCGFLIEFQHLEVEETGDYEKQRRNEEEVPVMIRGVLDKFKDVFVKPSSLPPKRTIDH